MKRIKKKGKMGTGRMKAEETQKEGWGETETFSFSRQQHPAGRERFKKR